MEKEIIKRRYELKDSALRKVEEHLKKVGHINRDEAYELFGTVKLSQIIQELEHEGYKIGHNTKTTLSEALNGSRKVRITEYLLLSEPNYVKNIEDDEEETIGNMCTMLGNQRLLRIPDIAPSIEISNNDKAELRVKTMIGRIQALTKSENLLSYIQDKFFLNKKERQIVYDSMQTMDETIDFLKMLIGDYKINK